MDYKTLEEKIEELNNINPNANNVSWERYMSLYHLIYEALLEMESKGVISIFPKEKSLGYLEELLINDGPEFSYTFIFWKRFRFWKKYKIGVCVRGLPICRPLSTDD
ncbi:hypothetical protein CSX00_08500 [Pseudobutyrivibrio ruminis]|uniref:Uncharacterized protein n=1 Tax=Pseudobutyrivibrio ruminis TaxID=46206 RepID=A0A2G3E9E2_9FIRM|nr:hypothetical protein [Pseudobutyrivibrio ruminis]PHU39938.1 hypothetical protein CSX00_08500 [Pseudobutyrivibrio ruminis]